MLLDFCSNISVGLVSGKAVLRNLSLKPEALDDLQLPIRVAESHVGAITVVVTSMTKISIEIDELYLVAKKREDYDWQKYEEDAVVSIVLPNVTFCCCALVILFCFYMDQEITA
jgi:hypothetical protein